MTLLAERKPTTTTGGSPLRPEFLRGFAPLAGAAILLTLLVALPAVGRYGQGDQSSHVIQGFELPAGGDQLVDL